MLYLTNKMIAVRRQPEENIDRLIDVCESLFEKDQTPYISISIGYFSSNLPNLGYILGQPVEASGIMSLKPESMQNLVFKCKGFDQLREFLAFIKGKDKSKATAKEIMENYSTYVNIQLGNIEINSYGETNRFKCKLNSYESSIELSKDLFLKNLDKFESIKCKYIMDEQVKSDYD